MAILAINCATEKIGLAILKDDGTVIEKFYDGPTIKAESLLRYIGEVLSLAKIELTALTGIGIANGPGAFTGLRLSLVTAKTIALKLQIPLVPISTLYALFEQYKGNYGGVKNIRVVLPACRGDVSTALFSSDFKRLEDDHPVTATSISPEPETFLLKDVLPDARTIALLTSVAKTKFSKEEILKLTPAYSHEARVNKTNKPELQHLKIGLDHHD